MAEFAYRAGALHAEDVPLERIAAEVGTPVYVYASAAIERQYRALAAALQPLGATICYAVKANPNRAVIATLARLGAGADVVSEGELRRVLAAGVPAERIVFSGIGKTRGELRFALERGVHQINVESEPELDTLNEVAVELRVKAPVALRVNPDVDALTHAKISTGKRENKFGVDIAHAGALCRRAARLPGIDLVGLAVHIGSQLLRLEPFEAAYARVVRLADELRRGGIALSRLDLGGGIGIRYRDEAEPDLAAYAAVVRRTTEGSGLALTVEPGRLLVGNAGVLVSRVIYAKEGATRRFLIVDAAMNDLIRPSLYEAWHDIVPVSEPQAEAPRQPFDVVGPVCESGDTFAVQRPLPAMAAGDLVAFCSAGAYCAAMSSTYNSRLLAPEVLVRGNRYDVIRPRQTYESMLAEDRLPDWLAARPRTRGAA